MVRLPLATGELLARGVQGHDPIGWRGARMAVRGLPRECPLKKRGDSGRHTGERRDVWWRLHLRELAVRAIGKSELLDGQVRERSACGPATAFPRTLRCKGITAICPTNHERPWDLASLIRRESGLAP